MTLVPLEKFGKEEMVKIKKPKDIKYSYASPFATGFTYNIHWKDGVNFETLGLQAS